MNRQEYLSTLEKELIKAGVHDYSEIIEEYTEHFDMKSADGYAEEEIVARLASPEEIAGQFGEIKVAHRSTPTWKKALNIVGLVFAHIFLWPIFITFYAWVIAIGAVALSNLVAGGLLVAGAGYWDVAWVNMLYMPYLSSLLFGISLLSLAVLSGFGTEYFRLYTTQIIKVFLRWSKAVLGNPGKSPPMQKHPPIKPKKRRIMRNITLLALMVFILSLVAGYISMVVISGSFEPWHIWRWFR
jgi:uncharacterized membrane protein